MSWLDDIVEAKVQEAIRDGAFDAFDGKGEPLELEDLSQVPAELRGAYSVLKQAGVLPEEMELRRSMLRLRDLLEACESSEADRRALAEDLRSASLRYELAMERSRARVGLAGYRAAVLRRLA